MTMAYDGSAGDLLRKTVNAKIALQAAEYYFEAVKAQAETRAHDNLVAMGKLGRTVEDRARQLVVALDADPDFKAAQRALFDRRGDLWRLQAELDVVQAIRQERELSARERMIDLAEQGRLPAGL